MTSKDQDLVDIVIETLLIMGLQYQTNQLLESQHALGHGFMGSSSNTIT